MLLQRKAASQLVLVVKCMGPMYHLGGMHLRSGCV